MQRLYLVTAFHRHRASYFHASAPRRSSATTMPSAPPTARHGHAAGRDGERESATIPDSGSDWARTLYAYRKPPLRHV